MAVVRQGSRADAMRACVRARAGSKPAREPSRVMGQAGSARDGEPRFRARDPHVRRRPIVARHGGAHPAPCARGAHGIFFRIWRPDQSGNVQFPIIGRWATPSNFFRSLIGIRSY